jgi:tRNA(fMet)-specific endonuclease VapC
MARHLLDSDSVVDVLKSVGETIALLEHLTSRGGVLCVSDVVLTEVYAGLRPEEEAYAERFLSTLEFLPTSADAGRRAGRWRYSYARQGRQLSTTDCLIAATALEHEATLVTGNTKDFPMPEIEMIALPRRASD